jgi:ubiquinone/menaquinone biosynthesis C-methylase UbiE
MRAQALAHAGHPAVTYAAGSAEQIPLPDASCDAALLFFVWHHVVDREGAAQELRRVVKPGGRLFVGANFSDRMYLSEDDIRAGFARIEAALPSLDAGPQYETSRLLVFQR